MSTNPVRFGQIVKARREELDLNQLEVAAAGGPSNSTMTAIENGRMHDLERATAKKLDKGLQWEPGSARVAWQGGEPTPLLTTVRAATSPLESLRAHIDGAAISNGLRLRLLAVLDDEVERGAAG